MRILREGFTSTYQSKPMPCTFFKRLIFPLCCLALIADARAQSNMFHFSEAPKFSQSALYTYVYAVPVDSVRAIAYERGQVDPAVAWMQHPAYIIPSGKTDSLFLVAGVPHGTYLSVTANQNQIIRNIHQHAGFTVEITDIERIQVLNVKDTGGRELSNVAVTLGKKALMYDPRMRGYVVSDFDNGDILSVRRGADIRFFKCSVQKNDDYEKPKWENEATESAKRDRTFNGYLVTNKPVYLPHDTVKWKAYLEDPFEGNSLVKERLRISFAEHQSYGDVKQYYVSRSYRHEAPGVYFGEFVLGDSVRMDRVYNLDVYGTRSGLHLQTLFKAEDYLLDDTHLKVTGQDYAVHQPGDSVNLYAYAYNSNNLPVLDGQITITVTHYSYFRPATEQTFIPDTLYSSTVAVNPNGETNIGFSTKDFPTILQGFTCRVSLINSNNEHADTSFNISFAAADRYIRVKQESNRVHAELILNKKSVGGKGSVIVQRANGRNSETAITFPYDITVGENDQHVTFQLKNDTGAVMSYLQHVVQDAQISGVENFYGDTAILELSNPGRVFYRYSIFAGDDFRGYGYALGDTVIKVVSKKGRTVSFIGSYTWRGNTRRHDFAVFKMDRELDIELRKKDLVFPGQRDTISIRLSNKDGKAVSGTNVTVLAFNSQFKEDYTATLPYGGLIYPAYVSRQNRRIEPMYQITPGHLLATKAWLKRCGADTMFFYRNLYLLPNDVAWVTYDIPGSVLPQVGIYLQRGGYYYHPQVIYINDRPVYLRQASGTDPAGFFVQEGRHSLRFRTPDAEYRIPVFDVCAGIKTDLYLNLDSVGPFVRTNRIGDSIKTFTRENHLRSFVRKSSLPDMFQESELRVLGDYVLLYRAEGNSHYVDGAYRGLGQPQFFQWPLQISGYTTGGSIDYKQARYPHQTQVQLIGPFNSYDHIGFYQQGNTKLVFERERDYIYTFRPQMTRVEKVSTESYLRMRLSDFTIWPAGGIIARNPADYDSLSVEPKPEIPAIVDRQPVLAGVKDRKEKKPRTELSQTDPPRENIIYSLVYTAPDLAVDKATARVTVTSQDHRHNILYLIYEKQGEHDHKYILYNGAVRAIAPGQYKITVIWNDRHYSVYDAVKLKAGGQTVVPVSYSGERGLFPFERAPRWMASHIKREETFREQRITYGGSRTVLAMDNKNAKTIVSGEAGIRGVLKDEKGEPIVNAIVEVIFEGNTKGGTLTDFDGVYTIKPLNPGKYNVRFRYQGRELTITDVTLAQERIVTVNGKLVITTDLKGATVTSKRYVVPIIDPENPGGKAIRTADHIERSATRSSSDIASLSTQVHQGSALSIGGGRGSNARYMVDGVQLNPGASNYNSADQGETDQRANNAPLKGVMLDRNADASKAFFNNFMANMMGASGMRQSFRDWAIWEPNLWTGGDGITSFNVTYPDNLTSWKTYVLAMNRDGFAGRMLRITRAFKPLSAQLAIPRFLRYGDTTEGIAKAANYMQEPFRLKSEFMRDGKSVFTDTMTVHNTRVQKLQVDAPVNNGIDTAQLPLSYSITADNGYTDGEARSLPILPVGVTESRGEVFFMNRDTTVNSMPDASAAHFTGRVRIHVDGSLLEVMLREVENLKEFPHGCNEQLTTKLLAIYYEEAIKKLLNRKDFNNTVTKKKILDQLIRAQRPDGGFGWWSSGGGDYRITNYIISTMQKMNGDGWLSYIIRRGHDYLNNQLPIMTVPNQLATLRTLTEGGYTGNYKLLLDGLDTQKFSSIHDRLLLIKIRKQQGLPYRAALDSTMKERRESVKGIQWGERNYDWYRDDLAATLLAYSIVKDDSIYGKLSPGIMRYILFKREGGYYGSTAASGLVLTTILPDLLAQKQLGSGKVQTYVRISGSIRDSITAFPRTFAVREPKPSFSFKKQGLSPAYVSVVYDYFNTAPLARDSDFRVRTHFLNAKWDTVTNLKAGEKVTLRTTVTCKKEGEYIMIEVPIPAGCIQTNKATTYNRYPEAAREHFKDQTAIFCDKLMPGTYTFDINLEARYKGSYHISPARAGLMYYPEEYGNTEVKQVQIR